MTTTTQTEPLQEWIAELVEEMHGTVENGAWVLIEDAALREFVGRYIGDVIHKLAFCVRDPQAAVAGDRLRDGRHLPTSLNNDPDCGHGDQPEVHDACVAAWHAEHGCCTEPYDLRKD
jgi:hypothetical protein